ncbi:Ribosomal RNA small subunit methyltransferase H [Paraliobacillus sp. PM-2]|uniref:tRNA (mnm(5)s(2)U34)-methyltransferase n=1 Tax=Paraliobacillus sp. PM-2 TaxID=1462524 RepID=UPI00061CAED5|nr:class I SAM-dependent methyltransferase [Paraliobacillus sp. PM-2]CQR48191.1 Ribosomal RNA small subunit methyltransferase H [Paraliobacillus sp. PM-2]
MLKPILSFAHELIEAAIEPGDLVVDATCGNGNDTVILSKRTGNGGKVLAFDIQEQAIETTKKRLVQHQITNVELILDGHEHVEQYIPQQMKHKLAGAIFNLGYLPRSDKQVITKPATTIKAIDKIATTLKPGGIIVCVVYHGHPGGEEEKQALLNHFTTFDQDHFRVLQHGFINQMNNPPFILAIEKKSQRN